MSVRLRDERSFAVPPAQLYALLTDPRFQERRSAHLGTLRARCARRDEGGRTVLVLEEIRDTGWEPHRFESRHTTTWDPDALTGGWLLEQTGGPGRATASGTVRVQAAPGGCVLLTEGTLTVNVPVFGRLIERVAKRALGSERAKEAAFIRQALDAPTP